MRNIKFRGWDKDRKCFLPCIIGNTDKSDDNWICPLTFCEVNGITDWYHNDTCEIMQYTGLHDKNGKEIYEGDIVYEYGCNIPYVISYVADVNEGLGMDCGWYCQRDNFESWDMLNSGDIQYIEVIGNIYENPELLEYR